jgi:putative DNA primase/helicase
VKHLTKQFASAMRFPLQPEEDRPKLNLLNGTLHFTPDGVELKPFNKEDGLTYQLQYRYDPSTTAPLFKQFLDRVLPDTGLQKLVFQYLAYVFLPHLKLEKIALLYGGGANGKSALLDIFTGLLGKEQVCEYSLEGITKSEYERASIAGYLLNISTEISRKMQLDTFKKIASREPLSCRHIRCTPFIAKRYATSIFATNELPKDIEQTSAFFRRLLIIPFNVQIPESEQNPELAQTIVATELSGVLNYLVEGVQTLVEKGKFEIPEAVCIAVEEFRQEADNVLAFLSDNHFRPDTEQHAGLCEWYDAYKVQCSRDGTKALEKVTFARRLRSLGYSVKKIGRDHCTVVFASREDKNANQVG